MSDELYEELFRQALRIRLVEEKIIELYPADLIQSPVHLSIGQEAVAVGACRPLARQDLVFCSYRSHAFYLAKGGRMDLMFAELYGKVGGMAKGKAGSMHLTAPEVGVMGSSAIVASTIPHAVGAALAAKRRGTGQVVVALLGDGATEEGVFHESINFAALHRLPVIFLCENNRLAIHSWIQNRQAYDLCGLAAAYRVETVKIAGSDGVDPVAVHAAMDKVVRGVREDGLPRFVEVETCRYREHVGPGEDFVPGFRPLSDLDPWLARDPLVRDEALAVKLAPAIRDEIAAAVAFAEASPAPSVADLLTDVL